MTKSPTPPIVDRLPAGPVFSPEDLTVVGQAASVAEDLVSSAYKLSKSEWLRGGRFDIVTAENQNTGEQVEGPFAQILRYRGQPNDSSLESAAYDHYRICLQDSTILGTVSEHSGLTLYPMVLYILVHELIHVTRFARFQQQFAASADEIQAEEQRVHRETFDMLQTLNEQMVALDPVFKFFEQWRLLLEHRETMPEG